jgi:hypothetical protein
MVKAYDGVFFRLDRGRNYTQEEIERCQRAFREASQELSRRSLFAMAREQYDFASRAFDGTLTDSRVTIGLPRTADE